MTTTCNNQNDDIGINHECGTLRLYGTCQSCTPGYADCDSCPAGDVTCGSGGVKGCETDITTAQNCGSCGNVCPSGWSCDPGVSGQLTCFPPTPSCTDTTVYSDVDHDGYYGTASTQCLVDPSVAPAGYSLTSNDCNDDPVTGASVHSLNSCGVCAAAPANAPGGPCSGTSPSGCTSQAGTYTCNAAGGTYCQAPDPAALGFGCTVYSSGCTQPGTYTCTSGTITCTATAGSTQTCDIPCGNGIKNSGEVCDPGYDPSYDPSYSGPRTDTNVLSCSGGYPSVTQTCKDDCTGYTGGCGFCGDGTVQNPPESCDGTNLNGQTCITQGYTGGTLKCNSNCNSFDTSSCTSTTCNTAPTVSLSPASWSTQTGTAASQTFAVGVRNNDPAACAASTYTLGRSCPAGLSCGALPASLSVAPQGTGTASFAVNVGASVPVGSYAVSASATNTASGSSGSGPATVSVTTAPPAPCGNGVLNPGELCDGSMFNTAGGSSACSSMMGQGASGTLTCNSDCTINTDRCTITSVSCEDGLVQTGELNEVRALDDASDGACSATFQSVALPQEVPSSASYTISGNKAYYAWVDGISESFWDQNTETQRVYGGALNVVEANLQGALAGQKQTRKYECAVGGGKYCTGTPKLKVSGGTLYIAWMTTEYPGAGTVNGIFTARLDTSKNVNSLQLYPVRRALPDSNAPAGASIAGFNAYGDYFLSSADGGSRKLWIKQVSSSALQQITAGTAGLNTQIGRFTQVTDSVRIGDYTYHAVLEADEVGVNYATIAKVSSAGSLVKTYTVGASSVQPGSGLGGVRNIRLKSLGKKIYSYYTYLAQPNPNLNPSLQPSSVMATDTETDVAKTIFNPLNSKSDVSNLLCAAKASSSVVDGQFKDSRGERTAAEVDRLPPYPAGICGNLGYFFVRTRNCAQGVCTSDANDKAWCDKPSDCIFNKKCYSDITTVAATYFGGDTSQVLRSAWKDEVSADVNGDGKKELCDPGQWVGDGGTASGTVTDSTTGTPLINAVVSAYSTNKAYNYTTTTGATGTYSFSSMEATNYDFTASKARYVTGFQNNFPVQPSQNVVVDFQLDRATSNVTGYVVNISQKGVPGASVRVVGTAFSAVSDSTGRYTITGVPQSTYDLVASKASDGYQDAITSGLSLEGNASLNFTLLRSLGSCTNDCNMVGSSACDASCEGKGTCTFYSDETREACDGTFGIIDLTGGRQVSCCKGQPYVPQKADVIVNAKQLIKTVTPVLYQGKLVNLVTLLFIPNRQG